MRCWAQLLCILLCALPYFALDVLPICYRDCAANGVIIDDDFDVVCNETCKVQKCSEGCNHWNKSINSSCKEVCQTSKNSSNQWGLYCTMGCNFAVTAYIQLLKDEIGIPSAPYLVAGSQTHNSVTIKWEKSKYSNITYLVQWCYESNPKEWKYYDSENPLETNVLQIKHLYPYTKYKFRIAWILLPHYKPLLSKESFAITTTSYGVPSTAPTITSAIAVSPNQISVSWTRPQFPNGEIVSYQLCLYQFPSGNVTIKDVLDKTDKPYYMFTNLHPNTTYVIAVAARNNVGEGPSDSRNITTPEKERNSKSQMVDPYLLFPTQHCIAKHSLSISDVEEVIFCPANKSAFITGMAFHMREEKIYVSDSTGSIYCISMYEKFQLNPPIIEARSSVSTLLTLDWLNNHLYMVVENKINRCELNGSNCRTVIENLYKQPSDLHVDPFHGYLYWLISGYSTGELYRVDLHDISLKPAFENDIQLIIKDYNLETFTIDYMNFRILIPNATLNTIIATSLDGTDSIDIRYNSHSPHFSNVKSLTYHNNLFYWTTGTSIYGEEYHSKVDKYYRNKFLIKANYISNVKVLHIDSQPYPVPLNEVENVQALFQDETAKIFWSKPKLLNDVGKGAWQKWFYEIHLFDHVKNLTIFGNRTANNIYKIFTLRPNTTYSIKIRACSLGGKGEWSSEFVGKTLMQNNSPGYPYIIWSSREGIIKSDIIGENVEPLIYNIKLDEIGVTDINWYKNEIFLKTNLSLVYKVNKLKPHSVIRLQNISNAASIAIDWLAPKLYWSSPVQLMISRANLDGTQPESLSINTLAEKLVIDSPSGHLYWSTTHSVEGSNLNGDNTYTYMQTGVFSGKRVMGLTLNYDQQKIYWTIRNYEGSWLYSAKTLKNVFGRNKDDVIELIAQLPENAIQGPLWYFSDRLFWINEEKEALISDMSGRNVACFKHVGLKDLETLTIIDPALQPYPMKGELTDINVIPDSILEKDIWVEGMWNNFTIVWNSITNVNYGDIFYEIKLNGPEDINGEDDEDLTYIRKINKFPIYNLQPYTQFNFAIRAYTFWASSKQTVVSLHSPMSYPSSPENPRIFIMYKSSFLFPNDIEAEFRWSPPLHINGILLGYQINCWHMKENKSTSLCHNVTVDGSILKYKLKNLLPNCTYSFQVAAYNVIGIGTFSDIVKTHTSQENPIPKLLLVKTDTVEMTDLDTAEEHLLSNKIIEPVAVTYLAKDDKIFWLDKNRALMSSHMDGSNTALIHSLSSPGTSLTIDWIGRYLYWAEHENNYYDSIWKLDITSSQAPHFILNYSSTIDSIEVEPFTRKLIWSAMKQDKYNLMRSDTNGQNIENFFSLSNNCHSSKSDIQRNQIGHSYNCSSSLFVRRAFTIDRSNISHPELLWVDGNDGHIWASDLNGCNCRILVNANENKNIGLPPTSITADTTAIYWFNNESGGIYSMNKNSKFQNPPTPPPKLPTSASQKRRFQLIKEIQGVKQIYAIGSHLQSYPDIKCLYPSESGIPQLLDSSFNSLKLQLPLISHSKDCTDISLPTFQYTIYYSEVNKFNKIINCEFNISHCIIMKTYDDIIVLTGLKPFTTYMIQVAINNYYNKGNITLGPTVTYQTKEGVPSAPDNIIVVPVSPEQLDVYWNPSIRFNGKSVSYEVRWKVDYSGDQFNLDTHARKAHEKCMMKLKNLLPGTKYYIVVRAYSSGEDLYNDSQEVTAKTYDQPNNLTLLETNEENLKFSWLSPSDGVIQHSLEITELPDFNWHEVLKQETSEETVYNFTIENLYPRTKYSVRLVLTYVENNVSYVWPKDTQIIYETLGKSPNIPGIPYVQNVGRDLYQVVWTEPFPFDENTIYHLESKIFKEDESDYSQWKLVYNGTVNQWLTENLLPKFYYQFRVQAINDYGESNFSNASQPFMTLNSIALANQTNGQITVILASILPTLFFIASSLGIVGYIMYKRHLKCKQISQIVEQELPIPDTELATLRELPLNGNFVHQTNALYSIGDIPTDEELAMLPQIRREQIILTKFLGSGAFGEVFEGIAHDLNGENEPPVKVAIKTLRKGATDQEKAEFLKEAKLMSNFKHEHILQLLGVCLNNNPNFIILELMEGGDLLTYLRSHRPSIFTSNPLNLEDLLSICVDVAKGCKCLEEMHFVHRDLAARNCLVSSHDPFTRIVKIGDFGLARDIYKNDYYRKEGEGLLPVRWMAPESLVDGVFTNQSDVWAFGVLLWEVMTLGQQPYPARTNLEVLHYVRIGGQLDKPQNCPDDLHQLMVMCWSYYPENRPTFDYCLEKLKELYRKSTSASHIDSVHNHNYLGHIHNDDYSTKFGRDRDVDTWSTCSVPLQITNDLGDTNKLKRSSSVNHPPLQNISSNIFSITEKVNRQCNGFHPPKYLEILADTEDITDADGYEMPLPPFPSKRRLQNKKVLENKQLPSSKTLPTCSNVNIQNLVPCVDTNSLADLLNLPCPPPPYAPMDPKFILNFDNNGDKSACLSNGDSFYETEQLHSPTVTSALLKSKYSGNGSFSEKKINNDDRDRWSDSTIPCPSEINSILDDINNSGISTLSEISGIELNYAPHSSWC